MNGVVVPLLTETLSLTLAEREERVKADADLSAEWNKALNTEKEERGAALNTERGEWTASAVREKEDTIALIEVLRQAPHTCMHTCLPSYLHMYTHAHTARTRLRALSRSLVHVHAIGDVWCQTYPSSVSGAD